MRKTPLKRSKWSTKPHQKPQKAPRQKTTAQLKKLLDFHFSRYIRQKYSKNGICYCYTCNRPMEIRQAHCGHFISRQYLATRWEEKNCRPQCVGCNLFGGGKPLDFEENLKAELGSAVVERMKASRHKILKLDRNWYLKEIERLEKELST